MKLRPAEKDMLPMPAPALKPGAGTIEAAAPAEREVRRLGGGDRVPSAPASADLGACAAATDRCLNKRRQLRVRPSKG